MASALDSTVTWDPPLLVPAERTGGSIWRRPVPRVVAKLALVIVALNLLDAFATLRHLELGAEEVNPLMAWLLAVGPLEFVVGKHLLAATGVIGIAAHGHHPVARKMLNYVLLPVYVAIGVYQLILFAVI